MIPPAAGAGEVGVSFSAAPTVSGGAPPLAWSVASGALPTGLTLDGSTGAISGIPRAAGVFPLTESVSSGDGANASVDVTLRIAARLVVATRRLPAAHTGSTYSTRLSARGGFAPVRWSLARGTLPAGLRLSQSGKLAGKPRSAGSTTTVVRATDRLRATATQRLVLTISSS